MKTEGHELKMTAAITNAIMNYVAIMFVDDGDFPTISKDNKEDSV